MKFVVPNRKAFTDALAAATRLALINGTTYSTSGILIEVSQKSERVRLTGTDLNTTVQARVDVKVIETGVALVPSRLLDQIVKSLPSDDATFELIENVLHISAGSAAYTINAMNASDYPRIPTVEGTQILVDVPVLAQAFNDVSVSVSDDQTRTALTTVLFDPEGDHVRLVSTDSWRLTCVEVDSVSFGERSANIPGVTIDTLTRLLKEGKVTVMLGAHTASFANGDFTVTTRLVEGDYPTYRNLVDKRPEPLVTVECDPSELMTAIKRCAVIDGKSKSVRIALDDTGIGVSKETETGTASDRIAAAVRGEITTHFQAGQFIEALSLFDGSVNIQFTDPLKPAFFVSDDRPHLVHFLMPHKG